MCVPYTGRGPVGRLGSRRGELLGQTSRPTPATQTRKHTLFYLHHTSFRLPSNRTFGFRGNTKATIITVFVGLLDINFNRLLLGKGQGVF